MVRSLESGRGQAGAYRRIAAPPRYLASVCVHVASTVSRTGQSPRRVRKIVVKSVVSVSCPQQRTAVQRRIASGAELWFEKPRKLRAWRCPRAPGALTANDAVPCASVTLAAQISACMVRWAEVEGANTPMLVLMRLIRSGAAALVFAAALAVGGIAFAALGQPSP